MGNILYQRKYSFLSFELTSSSFLIQLDGATPYAPKAINWQGNLKWTAKLLHSSMQSLPGG
jgi:hypothetical protein